MAGGLKFRFTSDTPELARLVEEISSRSMPSEAAKALNRTNTFIRNAVADDVSQQTGISRALIKRRVKPSKGRRASRQSLRTAGFVGEATIPVSKLSPKPRRAGSGATYKTIPGQGLNPSAFYAVLKNGKRTAWVRKTTKRGSMREVQIRIDLHLRRSIRRQLRGPALKFLERTFFENMQKRVDKDIAKRGLVRR